MCILSVLSSFSPKYVYLILGYLLSQCRFYTFFMSLLVGDASTKREERRAGVHPIEFVCENLQIFANFFLKIWRARVRV